MKIYLVGGAVRDQLLGREVKERDWVVVGATPNEMLALGYKPVGKDFPVFLHPESGEEYALARTERKTAKGYQGFAFNADPSVSLEQDLLRRDLTINAIAQSDDGELIDPYHGQTDLKTKQLKHVSDAFAEDPVRILRIARFASRFTDFNIHPDTMTLMKTMVNNGEVDALVAERVWKECYRALEEPTPWRFFETLDACGALTIVFPELIIDYIKHLHRVVDVSKDGATRFAALLYDMNADQVKSLCRRVRAPSDYQNIAILVAKHKNLLTEATLDNPEKIVGLLEKLDCYRRPRRLKKFVLACGAIDMLDPLEHALKITMNVDAKQFVEQGLKHEAIGDAIRVFRIKLLT